MLKKSVLVSFFVVLMLMFSSVSADTIILRSDDAQAWWSVAGFKEFHDIIQARGIPVTVGVIPTTVEGYRLNTAPALVTYLKSMSNTDLAQHGYMHELHEFGSLTEAEANTKIQAGKAIMMEDLGETPVTFLPPYGETSSGAIAAIASNSFMAMGNYMQDDAFGENPAGLYHIPITTEAYNYGTSSLVSEADIESSCNAALSTYDVCVIIVHFHYFLDTNGEMTTASTAAINAILDYIESKHDAGTSLATYESYASIYVTNPNQYTPPVDNPAIPDPVVPIVNPPGPTLPAPAPPAVYGGIGAWVDALIMDIFHSFNIMIKYVFGMI